MKLKDEQIGKVMEMNLGEAYDMFLLCKQENPDLRGFEDEIVWGKPRLQFSIRTMLREGAVIRGDRSGDVVIFLPREEDKPTRSISVPAEEYDMIEEERLALLKKTILDHMTEDSVFEDRAEEVEDGKE